MINFADISKGFDITESELFNASVRVIHALTNGHEFPYADMKLLSDNHAVGCHCSVCNWVDDKDYEQMILHPESEPEYCF